MAPVAASTMSFGTQIGQMNKLAQLVAQESTLDQEKNKLKQSAKTSVNPTNTQPITNHHGVNDRISHNSAMDPRTNITSKSTTKEQQKPTKITSSSVTSGITSNQGVNSDQSHVIDRTQKVPHHENSAHNSNEIQPLSLSLRTVLNGSPLMTVQIINVLK